MWKTSDRGGFWSSVGIVVGMMLCPGVGLAQAHLPTLTARQIAPAFFVIDEDAAHGGAISVLIGADGPLIVDSGIEPLAPQVAQIIADLDIRPVRFVLNTHGHIDETGGNAWFAGRGATIIARSAVRRRMEAMAGGSKDELSPRDARQVRAVPEAAMPTIMYDGELRMRVNGQAIRMIGLPPAHTDGDALAVFPDLDVIVAGDVLRVGEFPSINRASGGTLPGMEQALDRLIALTGERTRIVTSRGVIGGRSDAIAQRALLVRTRLRVQALIAAGQTIAQVLAAQVTQDSGVADRPGRISAAAFVEDLYRDLRQSLPGYGPHPGNGG